MMNGPWKSRKAATFVAGGVLGIGLAFLGLSCNPPPPPECTVDADCDDGLFCNGPETCAAGTCASGQNPCTEGQTCDEDTDTCLAPPECADAADCDDGLFCNGQETCADGTCQPGANPCAEGDTCDEDNDTCTPPVGCLEDSDCAEGEFCDVMTGECVANENAFATTALDTDFDRVHGLHQTAAGVSCADCHHNEPVSAGFASCRDCHADDPNEANSFKDVAHDQDESGDGCRQCHATEFDDNCAFCHTALTGQ